MSPAMAREPVRGTPRVGFVRRQPKKKESVVTEKRELTEKRVEEQSTPVQPTAKQISTRNISNPKTGKLEKRITTYADGSIKIENIIKGTSTMWDSPEGTTMQAGEVHLPDQGIISYDWQRYEQDLEKQKLQEAEPIYDYIGESPLYQKVSVAPSETIITEEGEVKYLGISSPQTVGLVERKPLPVTVSKEKVFKFKVTDDNRYFYGGKRVTKGEYERLQQDPVAPVYMKPGEKDTTLNFKEQFIQSAKEDIELVKDGVEPYIQSTLLGATSLPLKILATGKVIPGTLRTAQQIYRGAAQAIGGSEIIKEVGTRVATEEQQKFIRDENTFGGAMQAGYQSEINALNPEQIGFIKTAVQHVKQFAYNVPLLPLVEGIGNKEAFDAGVREYYKGQGLTDKNLEIAVEAATNQRVSGLVGEFAGVFGANVGSEIIGQANLRPLFARTGGRLPWWKTAGQIGRAGASEGAAVIAAEQSGRFKDFDQAEIAKGAAYGAITAGIVGGTIGKLKTGPKPGSQVLGGAIEKTSFIVDPLEKPGDIGATFVEKFGDYLGKRKPRAKKLKVKVATVIPSKAVDVTPTITKVQTKTIIPTQATVPTEIPTLIPTKTTVPTRTPVHTYTPTEITEQVTIPTEIPTEIPSQTGIPTEIPSQTGIPVGIPSAAVLPAWGWLGGGYYAGGISPKSIKGKLQANKILDITKGFGKKFKAKNSMAFMSEGMNIKGMSGDSYNTNQKNIQFKNTQLNTPQPVQQQFNIQQPQVKQTLDPSDQYVKQTVNKGFGQLMTNKQKNKQLFSNQNKVFNKKIKGKI